MMITSNITYFGRRVIGLCSLCGGPVAIFSENSYVEKNVPTCMHCGAIKREAYGPVIDMVRPVYPPYFTHVVNTPAVAPTTFQPVPGDIVIK